MFRTDHEESDAHVECSVHLSVRDLTLLLDGFEDAMGLGQGVQIEAYVGSSSNSLKF